MRQFSDREPLPRKLATAAPFIETYRFQWAYRQQWTPRRVISAIFSLPAFQLGL
jgi:hypothetical protein